MSRPFGSGRAIMACAFALALVVATSARAADSESELQARFLAAYRANDFPAAAEALSSLTKVARFKGVAFYNLACVRCKLGERPEAQAALRSALEHGFVDFPRATKDLAPGGELACVATSEIAQAIRDGADELQQAVLDARLKRLRALAPDAQQHELRDDARRLVVLSGHSPRALSDAATELNKAEALWNAHVAPAFAPALAQGPAPRASVPDPYVIVWLPAPDAFATWARREVGPGGSTIGGLYRPHTHELVARDLGPTLRHEFWHALHHRVMSRLGQDHPLWLQEGLCSLVEDSTWPAKSQGTPSPRTLPSTPNPDPGLQPSTQPALDILAAQARLAHNWRSNMARRMLDRGTLPKLSALLAMSDERFMDSGSLGRYAAARTLLLYLHTTDKLQPFLQELTTTWPADPTGAKALAKATDQSLDQLDKAFRAWLKAQPEVPEAGQPGTATARLPFDVDERGGEGLTVLELDAAAMLKLGIAPGEVLVAIDAMTVREANELAGALAGKKPGQRVELTLRKGRAERRVKVTLIAENN